LCAVQNDLRKPLAATGLDSLIGESRIFPESSSNGFATRDAINFAYAQFSDDVCAACPRRPAKIAGTQGEPIVYEI
jgi:hypothetical protein